MINVKHSANFNSTMDIKKENPAKSRVKTHPRQNQRLLEEKMLSFLQNQLFCGGLNGENLLDSLLSIEEEYLNARQASFILVR